jgi:hypothetical protein
MRRENEKVPAIGNMPVNARGDQIKGGKITKTADEIARERGRVQSVLVSTGLKGPMPADLATPTPVSATTTKAPATKSPVVPTTTKVNERELSNKDIVIDDSDK